ncbi:MAG: hypothetical protein PWR27_13 [Petroclostridium sp.]|jgi:hypothetical protein|uniref:hypothetical protein n=1 Tax=Petroclostridium xylanilyticum TaxID=1792311 RepID=UPI000B98306C|nr:hypothetical protein [Petroclostridium xylanilyticum]MBZ4645896.1 hypothetical protein [Clostridia bacterium]MDK2809304.1 hypothetical protein [Petroclostridium sp.]
MLPDVLGYKLEKGKSILMNNGYTNIQITFTKSPYNHQESLPFDSGARILRIRQINDCTVELLVCYV